MLITRSPLKCCAPLAWESIYYIRHRYIPARRFYRTSDLKTESSTPTTALVDTPGRATASKIKRSSREETAQSRR